VAEAVWKGRMRGAEARRVRGGRDGGQALAAPDVERRCRQPEEQATHATCATPCDQAIAAAARVQLPGSAAPLPSPHRSAPGLPPHLAHPLTMSSSRALASLPRASLARSAAPLRSVRHASGGGAYNQPSGRLFAEQVRAAGGSRRR
jgi:hypothetical protein